jgi:stage II sporulation protein E
MRSVCWESEYSSSLSTLGKISSALGKNGHISKGDFPAHMVSRCSYMPDIIDQINHNSMMHTQQLIIGDKTEIFALDYESISELLTALLSSQKEEFEYREELSKAAKSAMDSNAVLLKSIFAYGNERQYFFILSDSNGEEISSKKNEIRQLLEGVCGEPLEYKSANEGTAVLSSAKKYKIEYAKRSVKAEGEEGFCGDTLNVFESAKEHFYSFISDGMGSGREAALTSGICSVFLSKILTATSRCDISLEMLNGFLRNKGSGSMHECSATVDLLDLDLITGKAEFYKSGAAPSYIFRDGNLFKLRSNTVPLGIIKELDSKKISIDAKAEDIIVMVSDGVTQSKDECPWLFDLLKASVGKESLASIADMIVKRAKYEGADDDVSVIVMRVGEI